MKKKFEIQYIDGFSLLSREHFLIVKGIAVLVALVAYILMKFYGMSSLGPVIGAANATFLFCSGFGLSESRKFKGSLIHYWENKIISVWIPSLVQMIICSLIFGDGIVGWTDKSTIGLSGYFLYILFGFYAAYWLAVTFFEEEKLQVVTVFALAAVAFFLLKERQYADQLLAFPVGVMISTLHLREKLRKCKTVTRFILTGVFAALAVGGYFLGMNMTAGLAYNAVWMVSRTATALLLVFGVGYLQWIPIFGVFAPFGLIAYGLYLFHEDILGMVKKNNVSEGLVISLVVLIASASVFSWLRTTLINFNKKMRRRKKTHLKGSMW